MIEHFPGLRQIGKEAPSGHSGAIYVVGDERECALVDAGSAEYYPLLRKELAEAGIAPMDIQAVYLTHGHVDHYGGAIALQKESDAIVYVGEGDRTAVESGDYFKTGGFFYGKSPEHLVTAEPIYTGYERKFGSVILRALETPGHTPGSMTYEIELPQSGALVALLGDIGWGGWHERIGSDLEAWRASMKEIQNRNYTHVSFGHGINYLVPAEPHLSYLYEQIGRYANAYDDIPTQNFELKNTSI